LQHWLHRPLRLPEHQRPGYHQ